MSAVLRSEIPLSKHIPLDDETVAPTTVAELIALVKSLPPHLLEKARFALEDVIDAAAADEVMRNLKPGEGITLDALMKECGLDDLGS